MWFSDRFFQFIVFPLLLALASCSTQEEYLGKYWHAGSERPYVINGIKYYPQVHYQYTAVGESSWYGYDAHGLPTATGRKFDKNKLTAAHRTLPLPSIVIVENLENGKKVKLLVNDRGPFSRTHRRIIDISQRAAEILGFRRRGYIKVKVTCLPKESQLAAIAYGRKPYPSKPKI
ncbi:MAG: septal ring lytic transglycosylase RlpA family protein [Holosporaceae bacterium]|jgi:rare lipoprotein A|nr:septal ring lytic transglycosylase RlpA family protein [Holosporaceae bacterium]